MLRSKTFYMSIKLHTALLLFFLNIGFCISQNNCNHQLILNDSFGDGWEGSQITLFVNGNPNVFTLDGMNDDGFTKSFNLALVEGDSVTIEFISGGGDDFETSITFLDSDNQILYSSFDLQDGILYDEFILCPLCPALDINSVTLIDTSATTAMIAWVPSVSPGMYVVEYQTCGDPSTLVVDQTTNPNYTFNGLLEDTCYEYDLYLICNSGDTSIVYEGQFHTIWNVDVGISGVVTPFEGQKCEYSGSETLEVFIKNYGAQPQSLIPFNYSVNGVPGGVTMPTDGLYTGVIGRDSCHNVPFLATLDIRDPGIYEILIWTEFEDDSDVSNDTFSYTFVHTYELPFSENFEMGEMPAGWTSNKLDPIYLAGDHTNFSAVLAEFMDDLNVYFVFNTARYGILENDETLLFNYRFISVNGAGNPAGHQLGLGDELTVEASIDCGETWDVIFTVNDMTGHVPSTSFASSDAISLAAYAGESVEFRFTTTRGTGEYWVDFDLIQIYECDNNVIGSDATAVTVENTSAAGAADGSILINTLTGLSPFTFNWSNGTTTNPNTGLVSGIYTVTVTDREGCTQVESYEVQDPLSTNELADLQELKLMPNPVSDILNINGLFSKTKDLNIELFNSVGQKVFANKLPTTKNLTEEIDMNQLPPGIYYLNISDGEGQISKKIVKL